MTFNKSLYMLKLRANKLMLYMKQRMLVECRWNVIKAYWLNVTQKDGHQGYL
jgi:hypothetical protein